MLGNRISQKNSKLLKKNILNHQQKKKKPLSENRTNFGVRNNQINASAVQLQARDIHHHFQKHFASKTELMYAALDKHCYLPPHLSSIQIKQNVFRAEPRNSRIRPCSGRKYDYDTIYSTYETKYQVSHKVKQSPKVSRQWSGVKSKIKYLIDQDRLTYNHFHCVKSKNPQRQKHPDDDLSEESSIDDKKQ